MLDSTVVDDAVATQDTVTQLVAAVRRVRRLVPAAAAVEVSAHDYEAAGKPLCAWDDAAARDVLVTGLVIDALPGGGRRFGLMPATARRNPVLRVVARVASPVDTPWARRERSPVYTGEHR